MKTILNSLCGCNYMYSQAKNTGLSCETWLTRLSVNAAWIVKTTHRGIKFCFQIQMRLNSQLCTILCSKKNLSRTSGSVASTITKMSMAGLSAINRPLVLISQDQEMDYSGQSPRGVASNTEYANAQVASAVIYGGSEQNSHCN